MREAPVQQQMVTPVRRDPLARCYARSRAIAALLALAAGVGVFVPELYRDGAFAAAAFRGNDLVSLFVGLPLLVISVRYARRGSVSGQLVWLGALGYVTYTYLYTFAIAFNPLFLVYVALVSLSAGTLVQAIASLELVRVASRFNDRRQARRARVFLWTVGGALGLAELAQVLAATFSGGVPDLVRKTEHPTGVVYILDLGMVVPLMLLAGVWLRAARPWAPVAAVIMLVKGATVGLALLASNLVGYLEGQPTDGALIGLWLVISAGSVTVLRGYLRSADSL